MRYLALLRGINVGGKNIVKMPDLKACFERLGLGDVVTYIQSGNVMFDAPRGGDGKLCRTIEEAVELQLGCASPVVIIKAAQMGKVVQQAPPGFGSASGEYRYDVAFVKPPVSAREILPTISLKDGVDEADAANGVLYFRRLIARATQSHMSKLVSHPAYKNMTIRNWNTTSELWRLMRAK